MSKIGVTDHEVTFTFKQTPRMNVPTEKGGVDGYDGGVDGSRSEVQDELGDLQ